MDLTFSALRAFDITTGNGEALAVFFQRAHVIVGSDEPGHGEEEIRPQACTRHGLGPECGGLALDAGCQLGACLFAAPPVGDLPQPASRGAESRRELLRPVGV